MNTYEIYSGGVFTSTQNPLQVYNPYSGALVAKTYLASDKELENAINKAQEVKAAMQEMPVYQKFEILMTISEKLKADRERLAQVLVSESAKPIRYALGEIDRAAQTFLVTAEEAKRIPAEYFSIDWTPAGKGKEAFVKQFPIGLVAGIAPFNFPLNLAVHKIAPAIASGNPIILKPARSTPLSVLELAKIIDQTDLPKGAVSILPMDRVAGNQLVTDPRFNMLTFTGSPEVGWKMKTDAGKKKVALELGGNAGVVVSESANIDWAVQKCLVGGFAYSGQVCIHVQRIFVHYHVFDEFAVKFIEAVTKMKQGSPDKPDTEISAMIDEHNATRVEAWVNEAVESGARVLVGGKRHGTFYEPTVLTNTQTEMKVCALEVFGPVVSVEPINRFTDAIELINNSEYGLQAGVFTDSLSEMNHAYNKLEVGGVIINDVPTFRVDHMPYGGIKNSGMGREGIRYAMHEMTEPKLLVKDK